MDTFLDQRDASGPTDPAAPARNDGRLTLYAPPRNTCYVVSHLALLVSLALSYHCGSWKVSSPTLAAPSHPRRLVWIGEDGDGRINQYHVFGETEHADNE